MLAIIMYAFCYFYFDKHNVRSYIPDEYKKYHLYPSFAVASDLRLEANEFKYFDNRFGTPISGNSTLYAENIDYVGGFEDKVYTKYQTYRIAAYDISQQINQLSQKKTNKNDARDAFLGQLFRTLIDEYWDVYLVISEDNSLPYVSLPNCNNSCFGAIHFVQVLEFDNLTIYSVHGIEKRATCLISENYLTCVGDTLYQIRINYLDSDMYYEDLEPKFIIDQGLKAKIDNAKKEYKHNCELFVSIITACCILSIICFLVSFIKLIKTNRGSTLPNYKTTKLMSYLNFMAILEVVLIIILLFSCGYILSWYTGNYYFDDDFVAASIVLALGSVLKLILMHSLNKKAQCENEKLEFLSPRIYKRLSDKFSSPIGVKMYEGFIYYPLYYACTVPFGCFVLIYEAIAALCFEIYFAIKWIFGKNNYSHSNKISYGTFSTNSYENTAEQRLDQLKSLLDKGLINQSDYEDKKKEILNEL